MEQTEIADADADADGIKRFRKKTIGTWVVWDRSSV
jgi:hypothetical protein